MPVTPFHFGPGLLGKAVVNRYFSFTSFAITQVVIDVETAYYLVRNEWPLHRAFHTMLVGTAVGGVGGGLLPVVGRIAARRARGFGWRPLSRRPERGPMGAPHGGGFG